MFCCYINIVVVSVLNMVLDLVHLKKDRTDASIYQQLFNENRDKYRDYIPVYTDESRDGNSVLQSNTNFLSEM